MTHALHLIDDMGMGGVTRFLEQVRAARPDDRLERIDRRSMTASRHDADVLVSHLAISWKMMPQLLALRACNPSARLIHIEHSYCRSFAETRVPSPTRFRTLLISAYALFDEIVCVSRAQAAWMIDGGVVPRAKIRIAPPVTDLAPFSRIASPVPDRQLRYGFVGRLTQQKGIDLALEAWRLVSPPGARLEIFGDGPMRADLQKVYGSDRAIRFHGATERPAEAYEMFDIAIMPSRWEPYGLSCLEARATGRAVIASAVDGLPEQITGAGGRIVSSDLAGWISAFTGRFDTDFDRDTIARRRVEAGHDSRTSRKLWSDLLSNASSLTPT